MRFLDLISLPLAALGQQKMRTLLTTLGVVFGSFVLAASLSVGQGVQDTIERNSNRSDWLRKISVSSKWNAAVDTGDEKPIDVPGHFSAERTERFRAAIKRRRPGKRGASVQLTREMLNRLAKIEHIEFVVPMSESFGYAVLGERSLNARMRSSSPDNSDGQRRIVAGRFFETTSEQSVVVSEDLLYQLGLTDDAEIDAAIGRKLKLEFRSTNRQAGLEIYLVKPDHAESSREEVVVIDKIKAQLPTIVPRLNLTTADLLVLKNALQVAAPPSDRITTAEFTIVGIQRPRTAEEDKEVTDYFNQPADVVLPCETAADLRFRMVADPKMGLDQANVIVDRPEHVKAVLQQVEELGLQGYAPLEHIDRERLMYLLIFGGMTCIAFVALLVAALGIANTMLMSVLERTREIGIMKAVGADNSTLQFIFLLEGGLIGLIGGGLGVLAAWGASFPGDAYVRGMVARDLKIDLTESIFAFPYWLPLIVLAFAVTMTTLAALFPARRVARIDPVTALRHE
jgi:putative ABC transport system permease protein